MAETEITVETPVEPVAEAPEEAVEADVDPLDAAINAAEAKIEAAETGEEAAAVAPVQPEAPAPLDAPQDWRADQREKFAKLPDDAKALVLEQYKDFQAGFTRKSQELSSRARYAETMHGEFEPYRAEMAQAGLDETGTLRGLLSAYRMFKTDPVGYLRNVAQSAGIDINQLTQEQETDQYIDPATLALQRRLEAVERARAEEAEQAKSRAFQAKYGEAQAFAAATDEAGNLRHPHFARVQDTISAFVGAGQSLEDAYKRAVLSDPELHGEALKAAGEKARKAMEAERQAAVEKARKSGRHNVSGKPPAKGEARPHGLDAIISQAFESTGV